MHCISYATLGAVKYRHNSSLQLILHDTITIVTTFGQENVVILTLASVWYYQQVYDNINQERSCP